MFCAELVDEVADGGDDRMGDEATQAETGDRVRVREEAFFGMGEEVAIGGGDWDGFRSSGGGECLEGCV